MGIRRTFTSIYYIGNTLVANGRYKGFTPCQAAKKALGPALERKYGYDKDYGYNKNSHCDKLVQFCLKETTKGSLKRIFFYEGKRIKLAYPITTCIKNKYGSHNIYITYSYKSIVNKSKNPIDIGKFDFYNCNKKYKKTINYYCDDDIKGNIQGKMNCYVNADFKGTVEANITGNLKSKKGANIQIDGTVKGNINGRIKGVIKGRVNGEINGNIKGKLECQFASNKQKDIKEAQDKEIQHKKVAVVPPKKISKNKTGTNTNTKMVKVVKAKTNQITLDQTTISL